MRQDVDVNSYLFMLGFLQDHFGVSRVNSQALYNGMPQVGTYIYGPLQETFDELSEEADKQRAPWDATHDFGHILN